MNPPPDAVDPQLVGSYPRLVFSGGGGIYDDVLEYRVWYREHPGVADYQAFATFAEADAFAKNTPRADPPLALVRQREWLDEPTPSQTTWKRGERLTEWRVEWLSGRRRQEKVPE